jgi:(p)ppGpp synthase/HD superfamily hydrolase
MEVIAALAAESGRDGDLVVACALLHDVLEDTSITYAEIAQRFGEAIAAGVLALTKDLRLPKEQQMADSLQRIQQQPQEVWMVKLADRICNLQPPPAHWSAERVQRYRDEARLIHDTLGVASHFLAKRLLHKIAAYS